MKKSLKWECEFCNKIFESEPRITDTEPRCPYCASRKDVILLSRV